MEVAREKHFGNTVCGNLDVAEATLVAGLCAMEAELSQTQKLIGFS